MIHPVLEALVDIHENTTTTFNGIQNLLHEFGPQLDEETWQMAMWVAEQCYPDAHVINTSDNFEQIEEALDRIVGEDHDPVRLLSVIYVFAVLEHRGLLQQFIDWKAS